MSLISRLFRRSPRRREPPLAVLEDQHIAAAADLPGSSPVELPAAHAASAAVEAPAADPLDPSVSPCREEPEEAELEDAPETGEEIGPDPYVGAGEPLQISLPTAEGMADARLKGQQLALSGPQKITLTDPAGPGSLAETLARMEAEGQVTAEVIDDPEDGPFIIYRPVPHEPV